MGWQPETQPKGKPPVEKTKGAETMQRLIDAEALKERIVTPRANGKDLITELIDSMPTIDAEPVKHGKWKWLSCTYDRVPREKEYECSECHHKTIIHGDDMPWERYCPNCGARMDEE